jgi:hypothetical protein
VAAVTCGRQNSGHSGAVRKGRPAEWGGGGGGRPRGCLNLILSSNPSKKTKNNINIVHAKALFITRMFVGICEDNTLKYRHPITITTHP